MIQEECYTRVLQQLVAFDYLINNADRKSGHGLKGDDGTLWAIDHGICFHHEYKLRTILWDYVGLPLPSDIQAALQMLKSQLQPGHQLRQTLRRLLHEQEIQALRQRLDSLVTSGVFPAPGNERHFPWPPI
jgi:uncharacterized repeat protein (TIGR03843 family)